MIPSFEKQKQYWSSCRYLIANRYKLPCNLHSEKQPISSINFSPPPLPSQVAFRSAIGTTQSLMHNHLVTGESKIDFKRRNMLQVTATMYNTNKMLAVTWPVYTAVLIIIEMYLFHHTGVRDD